MKSYALAVAMAMLLAATYAFQNTGEILVRFLMWERTIPQGIWDVLLFAAGGILMWLVSLFALVETRGKYVRQIREKDKRIKELEEERASLMTAFRTREEPAEYPGEKPVSGPVPQKVPPAPPEGPGTHERVNETVEEEQENGTFPDERTRYYEESTSAAGENEDSSRDDDDETKGA